MNDGIPGDRILQQGVDDGGTDIVDQIGVLEGYVPLLFDGPVNFVDAATAWVSPGLVGSGQLIVGDTGPGTYPTSTVGTAAGRGMWVAKSGRSTGFTQAQVAEVGVAHWAGYPTGQQAFFSNSIAVHNEAFFTKQGDSGALVWTGVDRNPVGLHFASGSNARAFSNTISNVLDSLQVFMVA